MTNNLLWSTNLTFSLDTDCMALHRFSRGQIHEITVSKRFLCIISRILRLEVSVKFSKTRGRGYGFYQVFLLSPSQCKITEL
jgi:hypothetical protein